MHPTSPLYILNCENDFSVWRSQARTLLIQQVPPCQVSWQDDGQQALFESCTLPAVPEGAVAPRVSAKALKLLEQAARYRTTARWDLLYRVLWRLQHGDRAAVLKGDMDGTLLQSRIKAVSREAHHLHAFLRFQPSTHPDFDWVAWHEPAHDILESASRHFIHRMGQQRWLIATPVDAVHYDGQTWSFFKQCPEPWQQLARHLQSDQSLWHTYYRHIFNPARLNPGVMQGHMPARFWTQMEEGKLIPTLVRDARHGANQTGQQQDIAHAEGKKILASKALRKPPPS